MSALSRPLQHAAPHDEVRDVPIGIDRGAVRRRNPACGTGRKIRPGLRREETLPWEQRCRHTEDGVRTRTECAGLESRRPVASKHTPSLGVRRFGAVAGRHSQIEDGFAAGCDVDCSVCDLSAESCRTRAVRLETRTAAWESIETIVVCRVGGVPARAPCAPHGDARLHDRRSRDAVSDGAPQRTMRLGCQMWRCRGAGRAEHRDSNEMWSHRQETPQAPAVAQSRCGLTHESTHERANQRAGEARAIGRPFVGLIGR